MNRSTTVVYTQRSSKSNKDDGAVLCTQLQQKNVLLLVIPTVRSSISCEVAKF